MLAAAMVFSLAACGSTSDDSADSSADASDSTATELTETYKVGVILYDTSSQWALDIMGCLESIGDELGITFETALGGTDPEETIAAVQNFGAAGYDGIINLHPGTVMSTLVETCEEYGMYIVTSNDPSSGSDDYADFSTSEYFAGEVWEDEAEVAQEIVQLMIDAGATKFALHGFPEGLSTQMDKRIAAARELIEATDGCEVVVEGLNYDKSAAAEDIISQHPEIDAIFSSVETVSTVYQSLVNAGLNESVLLNCYDPNSDVYEALEDGTVNYVITGTCADTMIACILLYNAMSGNKMTRDDGSAASINMSYLVCTSLEDYQEVLDHCSADNPPYTFEELSQFITVLNEDASYNDLAAFAEAFSLEDIEERLGE